MSKSVPIIGLIGDDRPMHTAIGAQPWRGVHAAYVNSVVSAGACPVILPTVRFADLSPIVRCLDGIVLVGGGDIAPEIYRGGAHPSVYGVSPARDQLEIAVARGALAARIPLLAICRGMQIVNVTLGGTLVTDIASDIEHMDLPTNSQHSHFVEVRAGSILASVVAEARMSVNSLHHQAVSQLGKGVVVVARADDGTPEAIEIEGNARFLGVQWHPEMLPDHPEHTLIFNWLTQAAVEHGCGHD